jgi:hypothetical protein
VILQPQSLFQWRWEANELPRLVLPLRTSSLPVPVAGSWHAMSRIAPLCTADARRNPFTNQAQTHLPLCLWRETDARQQDLAMNATDLQRVNNFVMLSEHVRCDDEEVTGGTQPLLCQKIHGAGDRVLWVIAEL